MTETVTDDQASFELNDSHIKLGIIEGKFGPECWIYELEGEGIDAVRLMIRARAQAKAWGFDDVWANVSNPRLAMALKDHGWSLEQLILKGKTHGN